MTLIDPAKHFNETHFSKTAASFEYSSVAEHTDMLQANGDRIVTTYRNTGDAAIRGGRVNLRRRRAQK